MIVTIPRIPEHGGYIGNLITIEISDQCPKCGAKRGVRRWEGLSYDGSRRLGVDCWVNECGHIDRYRDVVQEYIDSRNKISPVTPIDSNVSEKNTFGDGKGDSPKKEIFKSKNSGAEKVFQRSNVPTKLKNRHTNNNINN